MTAQLINTGATRPAPRRNRNVLPQVFLGILLVYFLIPFWWIVINSSKDASGLFSGGSALWFATDIDYRADR